MTRRRPRERREYRAGEPLIARQPLQFSGQKVAARAVVPESMFSSERKRMTMWRAKKVDHERDLPAKKSPPSPSQAAPATPSEATVQSPEAAAVVVATSDEQLADAELEKLTDPKPKADRRGRSR